MEFQTIIDRALQIREHYAKKETQLYGSPWTSEDLARGFMGDADDVSKLIGAIKGKRNILDGQQKLKHKLADCLWSVIVIAAMHDVDLEHSFFETMNRLEQHLLENP